MAATLGKFKHVDKKMCCNLIRVDCHKTTKYEYKEGNQNSSYFLFLFNNQKM